MPKTTKPTQNAKRPTTKKKLPRSEVKILPLAPKLSVSEKEKVGSSRPVSRTEVGTKLPSSFTLLKESFIVIGRNWKVLLGYSLIYLIMNLILVQGLSSVASLTNYKHQIEAGSHGLSQISNAFSIYTYLLGRSGQTINPFAGVYQLLLAIFVGVAVIWSLRQIEAGYMIRIRDGFYRGMFPLVPFFLVMCMLVLQLVPFMIGALIYSIIMANGLAVNPIEQLGFLIVFIGSGYISLYLLCSSFIALYVVTLPDMTPMAALRTARDLVAHRRASVMRKILFLPLAIFVIGTAILVPVSAILTGLAPWALAVVGALALVFLHTYMFRLYRALL